MGGLYSAIHVFDFHRNYRRSRVLVHNNVHLTRSLGTRGFRAWYEADDRIYDLILCG